MKRSNGLGDDELRKRLEAIRKANRAANRDLSNEAEEKRLQAHEDIVPGLGKEMALMRGHRWRNKVHKDKQRDRGKD